MQSTPRNIHSPEDVSMFWQQIFIFNIMQCRKLIPEYFFHQYFLWFLRWH